MKKAQFSNVSNSKDYYQVLIVPQIKKISCFLYVFDMMVIKLITQIKKKQN